VSETREREREREKTRERYSEEKREEEGKHEGKIRGPDKTAAAATQVDEFSATEFCFVISLPPLRFSFFVPRAAFPSSS